MAGVVIQTIQLFNRSALGALWARKKDFDEATQKLLDSIYVNRKKGGDTECGEVPIRYSLANTKAGSMGYGRMYGSKGSMERLQAECRASLCKDIYHDLDIVNCQPTILASFAKRHLDVDMPTLSKYVQNRDTFLATLQETNGISREDAKQLVISIVFGASTRDPLLIYLSNEVRTVSKELSKLPAFNPLFVSLKNEKNHYGSFLAALLQTEERMCMLAMREFLIENGWSVDILCYDGLMIRKRKDTPITEDLLIEMAHHVKEETDYVVEIKEKEQIGFNLPHHVEDSVEAAYREAKATFEKNHFYFMPTNAVCEITRSSGIKHYTKEHAMTGYNTIVLPGPKGEDNLFIKRWFNDPARRFVHKLVYKLPEDCEAHEASLFVGFAYDEMDGDDDEAIPLFQNLLNSCSGDNAAVAEYILKYFAHMIQKPFEIAGTAVIFSSRVHGTGKDTLLNIMGGVIGDAHYQHYNTESSFWEKHDTGREGTIMVHLEEVGSRANKKQADALKSLITSNSITMNPKNLSPYTVVNTSRILMTTNHPDPVKLENTDRRFLIVNPSERLRAMGPTWWLETQSKIKSEAFLHTVGRFLEKVDLTDWNPRVMPSTTIKEAMLEFSKPQIQEFLENLVEGTETVMLYTSAELYKKYINWYKDRGTPAEFAYQTVNSFGMNLLPFVDKLFKKIHNRTGSVYYVHPSGTLPGV